MDYRSVFRLIVGTSLSCAVLTVAAAIAQDPGDSRSAQDRDAGARAGDSAQKIERAIRAYEDRAAQDLDRTRKDLDRMRKELGELTDLRLDVAIAVAELRAEMAGSGIVNAGMPGAGPQALPGAAPGSKPSDQEHRNQRASALNQQLRMIHDQVRAEIHQARAQTDQLVAELRALRAQQHQRHDQEKAARQNHGQTQDRESRARQDRDKEGGERSGNDSK